MTKPTVFNYKNHEELRQAYKELLADNQQLTADNRKLRKEVTELKQLNDGYVKIIAKNQETNNKLMATVQKQTGGDYISRADAIERIANDNVVGGMKRINEYRDSTEHNDYLDGISTAIATVDDLPPANATVAKIQIDDIDEAKTSSQLLDDLAVDMVKAMGKRIVEVVRCKDCRWFKQDSSPVGYGYCDGRMVGREVDYNDYCSYGERKQA